MDSTQPFQSVPIKIIKTLTVPSGEGYMPSSPDLGSYREGNEQGGQAWVYCHRKSFDNYTKSPQKDKDGIVFEGNQKNHSEDIFIIDK